jgi:hypothetical protein
MGNKKEHKIENEIEMKHCPRCDIWKALLEYNKQSSSWDKLARMCRKCYCEYKTNKRKTDEKYKQSDILYKQKYEQSGRRKEVSKIRYETKKYEIIKKCVAYNKNKYNTDPYFKAVSSMRTRISKLLKQKNADKYNTFYTYLGCNKEEFISYFQAKFKDGMTWNNHGEWHIDHIKPCASFNLLDNQEQKKCFHYTNLQPLWSSENLSKGCRYTDANNNL